MAVDLLPDEAYRSYLEPVSTGQDAQTHIALVAYHGDSEATSSHVKLFLPGKSPRGLTNEVVAYVIAKEAGLPVASKAGVLIASEALLRAIGAPRNLGRLPLWCTASVDGKTPAQHFAGHALSELMDDLTRWSDLSSVCAFDHWIANVDRHLNNMIRTGPHRYALIDHGHACTGPTWLGPDLDPTAEFRNRLVQILWGGQVPANEASRMQSVSDSFGLTFSRAETALRYWIDRLVGDAQERADLFSFLHIRADACPAQLRQKFGLLV